MKKNSAMRRYLILIGVEVLLLLVIVLVISFMHSQGRIFVRGPIIVIERPTVTYLLGKVETSDGNRPAADAEWRPLKIGQQLPAGAVVRTVADSRLDIRFGDGSAVRLAADTELRLANLRAERLALQLDKGSVAARFRRRFLEQSITIQTRHAVAGIRGTSLAVSTDHNTTTVEVLNGLVELKALSFRRDSSADKAEMDTGTVILAPNTSSRVTTGGRPDEPAALTPQRQAALNRSVINIMEQQVLLVTSRIRFEPNTDRILDESRHELESIAEEIRRHSFTVRINGHSADVGDRIAIQRLSQARAERIRDYLIEQGIPARRLQARGHGASRPVADGSTAEGRARNRRVEFVIID